MELTRIPGGAPAALADDAPSRVAVRREALRAIEAAAQAAYPLECCGALVGEARRGAIRVHAARPARNAAAEPARRYEIAAAEVRALDAGAAAAGLAIVGYYHSHPDRAPEPSATDLELALPGLVYLIVAVAPSGPGRARAWRLAADRSRFHEQELQLG